MCSLKPYPRGIPVPKKDDAMCTHSLLELDTCVVCFFHFTLGATRVLASLGVVSSVASGPHRNGSGTLAESVSRLRPPLPPPPGCQPPARVGASCQASPRLGGLSCTSPSWSGPSCTPKSLLHAYRPAHSYETPRRVVLIVCHGPPGDGRDRRSTRFQLFGRSVENISRRSCK